MMIRALRRRLEALESHIIKRSGPWPPAEGSFSYWLWDAIGRPGERRGFVDMYMQRAADFWKEQHDKETRK